MTQTPIQHPCPLIFHLPVTPILHQHYTKSDHIVRQSKHQLLTVIRDIQKSRHFASSSRSITISEGFPSKWGHPSKVPPPTKTISISQRARTNKEIGEQDGFTYGFRRTPNSSYPSESQHQETERYRMTPPGSFSFGYYCAIILYLRKMLHYQD